MTAPAITAEGLSKDYRLGAGGRRAAAAGLRQWWGRLRNAPAEAVHPKSRRLADQMDPGRPEWFWALRDVSFTIGKGEVVGIIGANGAGKSTLLKILARVTRPSRGRARIVGHVSSLLEVGTGFHPELTGRENVFVNGAILGMREAEIRRKFDAIVEFAEVSDFIDTPVKRYSSGMRTRLAFAVAAHLESEVMLLDEVLSVGDASFQQKCLGKMEDLAGHGRTVVLVSHRIGTIAEMCRRVLWLEHGRLHRDGPTEPVVESYLASIAGAGGERSWGAEGLSLRGDARFTLFALRLRNHRGEPVNVVDAGHEFAVEVEYGLRQPLTSLRVAIEFATLQGSAIFTTLDVDDETVAAPREAGRYAAAARIPAGLLAPGRRTVSLAVELPGAVHPETLPNLLSIDIMEGAAPGLVETRMRKGLVRPRLGWQVRRIAEPPETWP